MKKLGIEKKIVCIGALTSVAIGSFTQSAAAVSLTGAQSPISNITPPSPLILNKQLGSQRGVNEIGIESLFTLVSKDSRGRDIQDTFKDDEAIGYFPGAVADYFDVSSFFFSGGGIRSPIQDIESFTSLEDLLLSKIKDPVELETLQKGPLDLKAARIGGDIQYSFADADAPDNPLFEVVFEESSDELKNLSDSVLTRLVKDLPFIINNFQGRDLPNTGADRLSEPRIALVIEKTFSAPVSAQTPEPSVIIGLVALSAAGLKLGKSPD